MDKEMMAKINEILKANGKRELTTDELGQVVGGTTTHDVVDEKEMYDFYMEITRMVGFDVAHNFFMEQTGYVTYAHQSFGTTDDEEKMKIVLSNYWNMMNGKDGYH